MPGNLRQDCNTHSWSDLFRSETVRATLFRIAKLFAPFSIYFCAFYQQSETWTFQAKAMDRNIEVGGDSFEIPPGIVNWVADMHRICLCLIFAHRFPQIFSSCVQI